jgi:hypothetical protein
MKLHETQCIQRREGRLGLGYDGLPLRRMESQVLHEGAAFRRRCDEWDRWPAVIFRIFAAILIPGPCPMALKVFGILRKGG